MIDKDIENLRKIAVYFGYESQKDQLIEEVGEMLQALIKLNKNPNHENRMHLAEEIADVKICLEQVAYLVPIDFEVQEVRKQKIQRTLERIKTGYYK